MLLGTLGDILLAKLLQGKKLLELCLFVVL